MTDRTHAQCKNPSSGYADHDLPYLESEDEKELNQQTAYNRKLLESRDSCGCFYCRRIFPTKRIREWMQEDDGDETGICPFCGADALVAGTDELPLSSGLLARLYLTWFREEFTEKQKTIAGVFTLLHEADPFRDDLTTPCTTDRPIKEVGKIRIVPTSFLQGIQLDASGNLEFSEEHEMTRFERVGGIVSVRAYFDEKGSYCFEMIDEQGCQLSFVPWTGADQSLVLSLTKQYGERLMGATPGCNDGTLFLYIA